MRIAIVDDIESERNDLQKRLESQLAHFALHAEILKYQNGTDFLNAAKKERFTLVFLDIYMDKEDGIDTARQLRTFDPNCLLVFTTTSTDHALDGFRVRAMQYFVKPYTDTELKCLFDDIVNRLPISDKYIEVNSLTGRVRLRLNEILYAEHYQHRIHIYTADGNKTITRQTLREFIANLSDERFFLCNRGVLVNMEFAEDFDGADFILKNGKRLAVSRGLAKSARAAFGDFLFKNRGTIYA